jgi:CheY-like chemotaxis protein
MTNEPRTILLDIKTAGPSLSELIDRMLAAAETEANASVAPGTPHASRNGDCTVSGQRGVLVVDDDPDVREGMLAILEACGYPAVGAANGYDGLQILKAGERPGLIVLDLMMPVMDGWQFRTAQVQQEDLAAIPTLVCSARSDAEPRARSMGVIAYLRKPIDFDRLLDIVEAHCTRR